MSKSRKKDSHKGNQADTKKKKIPISVWFDKFLEIKFLGLWLAAFYFVVLAVISFTFHKVGDYGVETDFFWGYVPNAREFLLGNIAIDGFRGPLYPIVLGLFGFFIKDFFAAGVLIAILSASFVIYFTFEIIRRIFSPVIAFFTTLLLILNPVFIQYTYSAGTDMFFNALAIGSSFFFLKDKKFRYLNIFLAGLIGGLSYLTRYNGVFLLGFVIVILFVNYWELKWVQRVRVSMLFIAVFLLTISPWGLYCLSEKGSFFYNENYKNIAYELYGKDKIAWDQFWFKESSNYTSMMDVISRDPGLFAETIVSNIGSNFMDDMSELMGWQWGVFIIAGLFLLIISNPIKILPAGKAGWKSRKTAFYILNIIFFALLTLVFYSNRFSIFLIPFYGLIAVQPFFNPEIKFQKVLPKSVAYILLIGLCIYSFSNSYSFNQQRINSGPKELLLLRDWYHKNISSNEAGKKIAARKPHVAYYLDMKFYLMPLENSYESFLEKLKKDSVDYLYISPIEAASRPQFRPLLDPNSNHPGLSTVVFLRNPPSVLYKVK